MIGDSVTWTVLTLVASCASAWGGAKYALSYHEKWLKEHDLLFRKYDDQLQTKVSITDCKGERIECRGNRDSSECVLNGKLDRIFATLAEQDKRREEGKDAYYKALASLAADIAILKTILDERKNAEDRRSGIHRRSKDDI